NSLSYLESVVRELMRVHPPAVSAQRVAMEGDVLPLFKPYIERQGNSHDTLPQVLLAHRVFENLISRHGMLMFSSAFSGTLHPRSLSFIDV
ncbi:hypothetical protein C8R46DRAFT_921733, partial [Mycena filopes]